MTCESCFFGKVRIARRTAQAAVLPPLTRLHQEPEASREPYLA